MCLRLLDLNVMPPAMTSKHHAYDAMVAEYREMQRRVLELEKILSAVLARHSGMVVIPRHEIDEAGRATITPTADGVRVAVDRLGS